MHGGAEGEGPRGAWDPCVVRVCVSSPCVQVQVAQRRRPVWCEVYRFGKSAIHLFRSYMYTMTNADDPEGVRVWPRVGAAAVAHVRDAIKVLDGPHGCICMDGMVWYCIVLY